MSYTHTECVYMYVTDTIILFSGCDISSFTFNDIQFGPAAVGAYGAAYVTFNIGCMTI